MKLISKSILILIITSLTNSIILSQINSGKALYRIESKTNIELKGKNLEELSIDKAGIYIDIIFNKELAVSKYDNAYYLNENMDNSYAQVVADANNYICNDITNKVIKYKSTYNGKNYLVSEPYTKWKTTNESKIVNGYNCNKLEKILTNPFEGDKVIEELWYSTDLNIQAGPLRYQGFPGLVIRVETKVISINLEDFKSAPIENLHCELIGEEITKIELQKIKQKAFFKKIKKS